MRSSCKVLGPRARGAPQARADYGRIRKAEQFGFAAEFYAKGNRRARRRGEPEGKHERFSTSPRRKPAPTSFKTCVAGAIGPTEAASKLPEKCRPMPARSAAATDCGCRDTRRWRRTRPTAQARP